MYVNNRKTIVLNIKYQNAVPATEAGKRMVPANAIGQDSSLQHSAIEH